MISYSQNLEDVMLWRVLKDVKNGFYIDVGANDPSVDSVTRTFYESGWCGINIEPLECHFIDLLKNRPRDVNLQCAVGSRIGEIELWECDIRGWATADRVVIDQHIKDGHKGIFHKVDILPLVEICENYVSGQIHFLKIDVEGLEKDVLAGMDFDRFRPWVIVVEATRPNSTEEVHDEWEGGLLRSGYVFAYADGLNRFYLADERSEHLELFKYPPNVFDEYVRADLLNAQHASVAAETRAQQAETKAQQAETKAQQAETKAQQAETKAQQAEMTASHWQIQANEWHERILALHNTTSWRITKPLRAIKRLVGGDFSNFGRSTAAVTLKAKKTLRPVIAAGIGQVFYRPKLRAKLSQALKKFPWLHQRLLRLGINSGAIVAPSAHTALQLPQVLSEDTLTTSQKGRIGEDVSVFGPYKGKKVAVLAPGAADGTVGGAERFHEGLANALRKNGCDVDLIYKVFDESSFETIQQGYREFANLDLRAYDLVISTKAPTYVVKHPNHIVYLQHTIRVFYDLFEMVFPEADKTLLEQRDWIHKADTEAFKGINRRYSQAKEVSRRLRIWNGCDAEVLYPEIVVDGLYDHGIGDYFYMPGRLHPWKRVDLAIKAVKLSKLPLRLVISGTGEAEGALRELAGNDKRIEFLGRVGDEKLRELYASSLAVPFLPILEDYGYVTLEAFACGKPVITCTDSGEPVEFVVDGVTGYVCSPDPQAVCLAFERLWNDRHLAAMMGKAGRAKTADIKWSTVADRLLEAGFPDIKIPRLKKAVPLKVAVLDMQPIIPAVGGGRLRLLGLYHALGPDIEARYVGTYDWPGERYRRHAITPTLEEIDVPLSATHHQAAMDAANEAGGRTVIDMVFAQQAHLSPEYLQETLEAVKWAEVVVFSHPWVAPLIGDEMLAGKTVIYDSHNVEAVLRGQLLDSGNPFEKDVLNEVERAEHSAGDRADLVLACSREDADVFVARYGWEKSRIRLVPNGVFSRVIQPATGEQKREAREAFKITEEAFVGFFIGSDYAPNVEAGLFIIDHLARELPEVIFAISGGVCSRLPTNLPDNVRVAGFLDERDKVRWLHASDFAINPMFSGSGTNIKMFDFMSAALPVVTTPVGARGIAQQTVAGLRIADREGLTQAIRELSLDRQAVLEGGQENRRVVEAKYAWESVSPELGRTIRSTHFRKQGAALLASREAKATMRVAHLSTLGLKCGIGEYTRKIIDIYQQQGIANFLLGARAANEEPNLENLGVPASIVWFFDNIEWTNSNIQPKAFQSMLDWGATHLIVQYHPGFYSTEALLDFVVQAKEYGIAVTVVVHNFTAGVATTMRRLNDLGVLLFSHRMTEVMQASANGVLLDQIPLGVDAGEFLKVRSITQRDWERQPPIIVTTGFLRKHKGAITLIRAMPEVLQRFPGAQLRIQCALYPSEDSRLELEACEKEIGKLTLMDNVTLHTEFLEKNMVLAELAKTDIAVLPYENSNEGGSATAADCISVGLPLIVSDAEIFDEIREVVITTKAESEQIASAIIKILSDTETYTLLSNKSVDYALNNSWHSITAVFLVAS